MGKSSLLRRFERLACQAGIRIGWADEEHADPVSVMRSWVQGLGNDEGHFKVFVERERHYRERRHELEADPKLPVEVARLLGQAAGRGSVVVGRRIPIAGVAFDLIDDKQAGELAADAMVLLAQRLGSSRSDLDLVVRPLEVLTPLFLDGLRKTEPVALFFDTFEATSTLNEPWIVSVLTGRYGRVPGDIRLCFAGRDGLDSNLWAEFNYLTRDMRLAPFSEDEARRFLVQHGLEQDEMIEAMIAISDRMPLLLATLAVQVPRGDQSDVGAADTAVERFLKWVDRPDRKTLAVDASVARLLNEDVVAVIANPAVADAYEWLKTMPFVESRSGNRVYHDTVRGMMVRHQRLESPSRWRELHCSLRDYYEAARKRANELKDFDLARTLAVERTYHRVAAAGRACSEDLAAWVGAGARRSHRIALAAAIRDAERDLGGPSSWGDRLLEKAPSGGATAVAHSVQLITAILREVEDDLSPGDLGDVLLRRGLALFEIDRHEEAHADFRRSLALTGDSGLVPLVAAALAHAESAESAARYLKVAIAEREMSDETKVNVLGLRASLLVEWDPAAALEEIDAASVIAPGSMRLKVARAKALAANHELDAALASLSAGATGDDSASHLCQHAAAELALDAQRYNEAGALFSAAIDSDPSCLRCWYRLGSSLRLAGHAHLRIRQTIEATGPEGSHSLLGRADAYEGAGLDEDAIAAFAKRLEDDPDDAYALGSRGQLLLRRDQPQEAKRDLVRATGINPDVPWQWVALGTAYAVLGEEVAAHRAICRAIDMPRCPENAWFQRALILREWNDLNGALNDAREFTELQPEDPDGWFLRGEILSDLGSTEASLADFEKGQSLAGTVPMGSGTAYGLALAAVSRFDEALAIFQSFDNPPNAYNAAVAAVRGGRADSAQFVVGAHRAFASLESGTEPHMRPYALAGLAALAGDASTALRELRIAASLAEHVVAIWVPRDQAWNDLRHDPDFVAIFDGRADPSGDEGSSRVDK